MFNVLYNSRFSDEISIVEWFQESFKILEPSLILNTMEQFLSSLFDFMSSIFVAIVSLCFIPSVLHDFVV